MVRLVLWDIDGTLIRTGGAGVKAFARVFELEFHVPRATEKLSFAGRTDGSLVREFFATNRIPPTPENFQRFTDSYFFWLDHLLGACEGGVCPGVREMIEAMNSLPQPPLLGLLTGNYRLGAELKLRHYRLWDKFKVGAFADDHEDRNQLARVAQERGGQILGSSLDGGDVLVIGDTPLDIACARHIRARVLAVGTGGHTAEQLKMHQPDWVVENLHQISARELCG